MAQLDARPTGDQEVAGSTLCRIGNILLWKLIMKYSRRAVVSFRQKNVHNTGYPLEDYACPVKVWLGKLTALNMTPLGWLVCKTSTHTNKIQQKNTDIFVISLWKHTLWALIRSASVRLMSTYNICVHGEIRKYYADTCLNRNYE